MQGAKKQVPGPVAHEVGSVPVSEPVRPPGPVLVPFCTVMSERQVSEGFLLPTSRPCLQLVDPVPAVALLERQHALQASPSICTRRSPDRAPCYETLAPEPVVFPPPLSPV